MRNPAVSRIAFFLFVALLGASFISGFASSFLGFVDEAMLAYAIAIIVLAALQSRKVPRFLFFIIAYLMYSVANSYLSPFSPNVLGSMLQALIHLKLFIVAYAAVVLFLSVKRFDRVVIRFFYSCIALFLLGLLLNIIFQEEWNALVSNEVVQYRYGFIRPVGFFGHYAPNGYFLSLFLLTMFMMSTKREFVNKKQHVYKFFSLSIIELLATFPLTVRKGLFIIIPYGFYIVSMLNPARRLIFVVVSVVFLSLLIFSISSTQLFLDTIENTKSLFSDDHSYIRGLISYYGYQLFIEFFPLGVGHGLYGSVLSNMDHSVYNYIGLDLSHLTRADGSLVGIYDSGLASVMAEGGLVGMFFVVFGINEFFRFNKSNLDFHNYQAFKIITFFAILLSITEPVWQNGLFTTFYTTCLLYMYTKNNKYKTAVGWRSKTSGG